jgi:acyl dehydratase
MYFEEFNDGDRFTTRTRVITGTDVDLFAVLTGLTNPVVLADECGRKMGYKGRIVPGLLTLSLLMGLAYSTGIHDHARALVGMDKLRFLSPLNPGDSITCQIEVLNKKETGNDSGIIAFKWTGENQDKNPVLEAEVALTVLKKPS